MFVCFRHIKVERLPGKKPEFEMPPKEAFFFFFFFSPTHTSKYREERALISQAKKNQMMLSTFPAFILIIHQEVTVLFMINT